MLSEYEILERIIGRLDNIVLAIKGWCITVWVALYGYAINVRRVDLLWVAFFVVIIFWSIEINFRSPQMKFINRTKDIEDLLGLRGVNMKKFEDKLKQFKTPKVTGTVWGPGKHMKTAENYFRLRWGKVPEKKWLLFMLAGVYRWRIWLLYIPLLVVTLISALIIN